MNKLHAIKTKSTTEEPDDTDDRAHCKSEQGHYTSVV